MKNDAAPSARNPLERSDNGIVALAFGQRDDARLIDLSRLRHLALLPIDTLELDLSDPEQRRLGDYELLELIGEGGMGVVYRARQASLDREVAIKLLAAGPWASNEFIERFRREAQATANLNSPHTIRLYDFGYTEERTFYYVMELLAGRDLESLVRTAGPLPAERVLYLLRQVCHSLAEAHAQGLVHRDITPANIYACRMGLDYDFVKVLDFGLVSCSDPRAVGRSLMTGTHTTSGTPMANRAMLTTSGSSASFRRRGTEASSPRARKGALRPLKNSPIIVTGSPVPLRGAGARRCARIRRAARSAPDAFPAPRSRRRPSR